MSMAESQHRFKDKPVIVVMGSSGCGKSTIAEAFSSSLKLPYIEGDEIHPPSNVDKMSKGIPLTDDDRWPWFDLLGSAMKEHIETVGGVVVSCSALKRTYRDYLTQSVNNPTLFVYLHVSREELLKRMQSRGNHYMPASLLDSQLATLEVPAADEFSIKVDGTLPIDQIISFVSGQLSSQ